MPFLTTMTIREEKVSPDVYPFCIPALKGGNLTLRFPRNVAFFVGENGTGKSTVLEAIAIQCGFNPTGGSRNNVYGYRQTESSLGDAIRLSWRRKTNQGFFLRAESFFNFASYLDDLQRELPGQNVYGPYGGASLHTLSHGESFLQLFQHRFKEGIFLLDEPEAALSPTRQLSFLSLLHSMEQSGKCQFIIATHSPILLAYPDATIHLFTTEGVHGVRYEDTEHYRVTKDFLDSPERFFKHLFAGED
jgi:predicted ATPase